MKQITWTWKLPVWHMPFFPLLNSQNEHSAYLCHGRYLPWYPGWQCPKTYILVAPTFRTVRTMKASLLFTSDARYKYILLIARVVLNILPFHPNSSSKEFIHRYALSLSLSPSLPSAQRWRSWVKQHRKGHTNFAPAYNIPPRGESKFMHNFMHSSPPYFIQRTTMKMVSYANLIARVTLKIFPFSPKSSSEGREHIYAPYAQQWRL